MGYMTVHNEVEEIQGFRQSINKEELNGFLGLTNSVNNFNPNYSTLTESIRQLLKKNYGFVWDDVQTKASKKKIEKCIFMGLAHCNPKNETHLYFDASPK